MAGLSYVKTGVSNGSVNVNKGATKYPGWRWKPSFKGSWIDQDYFVSYPIITNELDSFLTMKNNQDYWRVGLRSGVNTSWYLTQAWSFYGNLSLSALWSQFSVDRKDTRNDAKNNGDQGLPPLNTTITVINTQNDFHTIKGILELSIGMRGEWWFAKDWSLLLVQAGWEEQLWLNHNQLIKIFVVQANHGDLILQGL